MAEMVYRRRRNRKVRMLDERRRIIPLPNRAQVRAALRAVGEASPALLLSMADVLEMPSGLHAAFIAALAALGRSIRWPMAGAAVAMLLRLLSGLDARWEGMLTLLVLLAGPHLLPGHGNGPLLALTAVSMLPYVLRGWMAPTAMEKLLCWASVILATLSAPVFCRGVKALSARNEDGKPKHLDNLEDRLGVAYLALMVMSGGARLLIAGVNAGMLMASAGVMALSIYFGAGAGCAAGLIAGTVLTTRGLPLSLALGLAMGGYLAGTMMAMGRRWISGVSFAAVCLLPMLLTGAAGLGCAAAVVISAIVWSILPETLAVRAESVMQRLRADYPQSANAYASSMLAAWEKTVACMAMSVPAPVEAAQEHEASWWTKRLCEGCPDFQQGCSCMQESSAVEKAEAVWAQREAEDLQWQAAMEALRGLGCQRLYYLRQGMDALRQEDAVQRVQIRRAKEQRSMLVTHLSALAGAARRFAHLAQGENWWDALMAARLRQALSEGASPVRLIWVRRVMGHVQAAFALGDATGVRRQAEELCRLVGEAAGVRMMTAAIDGDRVRLAEKPPLEVKVGVSSACISGQSVCGDTAWHGFLQDGRFIAAVSDGMGHGEEAALSSRQTVELLRLCLDAGYTLQQTVTAVNGMMLLGGSGERFITVDLMTIDLWSGNAVLEKLGASDSWVKQGDTLQRLTCDALPLGILEGVEAGERVMRLKPGDVVLLATDGVEEAFESQEAWRSAVSSALMEEEAQHAAECLMEAASCADFGARRDDQSVLVIRIDAVQTGNEGV